MRRLTVVAVSVLVCGFGGSAVVFGQGAQVTLYDAAANGDVAVIKQYIAKKANLNAPNRWGYTPLRLAVDGSHLEAAKVLLEGGANPNAKDGNGMTVLHWVAMSDRIDVAEMLLAAKADVSVKDRSGQTPLHCAVQMGQLAMVELLLKNGADVNATTMGGQTPLSVAQAKGNVPEIAEVLRKHGGTLPVVQDEYGAYGASSGASQAAPVVGTASVLPTDFVVDANAIREQLKTVASLEKPLKAVDANSASEQRAWIARRSDNRTLLLRAVQRQFEDEMAFVKSVAAGEKAVKTTKAVDDLVAARKKRYERIGTELREQRRQTLLEARNSAMGGRGRGGASGRSTRGRSSMGTTADPYGTTSQTRAPRRSATEPNEPPIDADTQAQIDAWRNTQPEDKSALLETTHELDVIEYAALHESAVEEKAVKTDVAVMALLMLREERIANIEQKWVEDDERMQRMQDRMGGAGMQQGTQGTQSGTRRGRR